MTSTATKELRAYHGDEKLKQETVAKAKAGREADEFVQGLYFRENGNREFCAVGCLTEDENGGHDQYPKRWGIPEWLAYLEDGIFEGLPPDEAKLWPERFLSAIPAGADFDGLADRLAIRRLKEECLPLSGKWPESIRAKVVAAIEKTIAALESKGDRSATRSAAWSAAKSAAWSAESAAESAAWSAAKSAAWSAESAAWSAARSAAKSAAWSATRSAAWSARSAAKSAAWSAESAAWSAAKSAAFEREADRLVAELEALPVLEPAA